MRVIDIDCGFAIYGVVICINCNIVQGSIFDFDVIDTFFKIDIDVIKNGRAYIVFITRNV